MARKRKGCCGCLAAFSLVFVVGLGFIVVVLVGVMPTSPRSAEFVRFQKTVAMNVALETLEKHQVVKSAWAASLFAKVSGNAKEVKAGTYKVKAGSSIEQVFVSLKKPYSQMVRLPEGWWIKRQAKRLEDDGVCPADEYIKATADPAKYADLDLNLPRKSLEGFLFPDTYDLPPLTPPEDIVRLQLKTFKRRVLPALPKGANLHRILTVGSMVELEAAVDKDRPLIAGVIESRIKKGIPLEIDATVLYALQEWKNLPPGVVRTVVSPYNTYLHKGLPPGPIGSPGLKSIQAALHPDSHGYLYYVARPNRSHYFAATYPEHLKNIQKARAEWRAAGGP